MLRVFRVFMRSKIVLAVFMSAGLALAMQAPSDQDIANAKSQGQVWVDPGSHVYYKDGASYGKTKKGKFMTEEEARKQGFTEKKKAATSKKETPKDQSGLDSTKETHSSTPPPPKL